MNLQAQQPHGNNNNNNTAALTCWQGPEVPVQHAWHSGVPTARAAGAFVSPQKCVPTGQLFCALSAKHDVSPFATLFCAHAWVSSGT